jgi:hypothetical protein
VQRGHHDEGDRLRRVTSERHTTDSRGDEIDPRLDP